MKTSKNSISIREKFEHKETIVTITSEDKRYIEIGKKQILKTRKQIEKYIEKNPFFKETLKPFDCKKSDPAIIKKMCLCSEKFNIGPMSTVAGTIAESALKSMISNGAKHAIVDNGGDIALYSNKPINIGIFTGYNSTNKLAYIIPPTNEIFGICTSSGNIGHSLSFGNTDAVTVFSKNVIVADAAATAIGNFIEKFSDIRDSLNIFSGIDEIQGSVVFIDNNIGLWGKIPKIIQAEIPFNLISRGWLSY